MGTRLTEKWTDTLDEAFGATGTKGRLGEEFLLKVFDSWGWDSIHYDNDYQKQIDGIDIEFKKPEWFKYYSCDVKNNMNEYGTIYVHEKWLFKIKSDRVFHVNPDTGWLCWYGVDAMRNIYTNDNARDYMTITASQSQSAQSRIITRTKYRG